jgi:hypothetical protein
MVCFLNEVGVAVRFTILQLVAVSLLLLGSGERSAQAGTRSRYRNARLTVGDRTIRLRNKKVGGPGLEFKEGRFAAWQLVHRGAVVVGVGGEVRLRPGDPDIDGLRLEIGVHPGTSFFLRTRGWHGQALVDHVVQAARLLRHLDVDTLGMLHAVTPVAELRIPNFEIRFALSALALKLGVSQGTPFVEHELAPGTILAPATFLPTVRRRSELRLTYGAY